jgi:hypothetical protein
MVMVVQRCKHLRMSYCVLPTHRSVLEKVLTSAPVQTDVQTGAKVPRRRRPAGRDRIDINVVTDVIIIIVTGIDGSHSRRLPVQ